MKCTWTSIGIRVVPASFSCCQSLLGQPHADRATALFGRVLDKTN
ncbi:MAG: hypothetical protein PVJ17_07135 [Lysobacterales bacterium]|jgi:hypothetical protein